MTNLPKHESSWLSKPELDDYARESSIRESGNLEDIKEYTSQTQRLCRQSFFSPSAQFILAWRLEEKVNCSVVPLEMFYTPASLNSELQKPQCAPPQRTFRIWQKNSLHILHTWGGGGLDISTLPPICGIRNRHLQKVLNAAIHMQRDRLKRKRRRNWKTHPTLFGSVLW